MKTSFVAGMVGAALLTTGFLHAEENLVLDGSTTVGPIAKAFAEFYMAANPGVNVTVSESGSGNGAKALLNGSCDIANLSRGMKDTELAACKEKGVDAKAHTVAYDALSLIVHPSNPVKELSREQVNRIYTGEIANWKEVGGVDQAIVVISRDTNSGTYESFKDLVLAKDAKIKPGAEYVGSNGAGRQRVQTTPSAIAFVGLGFVDATVKALSIDGVMPSVETTLDHTYPVARSLFMYTNGKPAEGSHAARFLALAQEPKGREIVEEIGFVPLPEKK